MPFGERALFQLFKLKEGGECVEFENLKRNPHFEEIAKELIGGQGEWQSTPTTPMPTSKEKTSHK